MNFKLLPLEQQKRMLEARISDFSAFLMASLNEGSLEVCETVEQALESAMNVYIDYTERKEKHAVR